MLQTKTKWVRVGEWERESECKKHNREKKGKNNKNDVDKEQYIAIIIFEYNTFSNY